MLKYVLKRLLSAGFTLAIILTIVFFLLRQMPIEGYFDNFDKMSEAAIQSKLRQMGLNDPFFVQLKRFFTDLLHGDLGASAKYRVGESVAVIIRQDFTRYLQTYRLADRQELHRMDVMHIHR